MQKRIREVSVCESHVTTRLHYVHKSMGKSGFLKKEQVLQIYLVQKVSVTLVPINLNVLNGVLNTKDSVSGVD